MTAVTHSTGYLPRSVPQISYSKYELDCFVPVDHVYQTIVINFSFYPSRKPAVTVWVSVPSLSLPIISFSSTNPNACNITGGSWNRWCSWVAGTTGENRTSRFWRTTGN